MDTKQRRIVSLVSSSALALLTIAVFAMSLNKGPASSVTRFNEAIVKRDFKTLRAVTLGDLNSQGMQIIVRQILDRMDPQAVFQIVRVERKDGYAFVHAVHKSPRYNVSGWIFATRRYGNTWLVDPDLTLAMTARQSTE